MSPHTNHAHELSFSVVQGPGSLAHFPQSSQLGRILPKPSMPQPVFLTWQARGPALTNHYEYDTYWWPQCPVGLRGLSEGPLEVKVIRTIMKDHHSAL